MKVLVACEYSGRVRDAFRARGHSAYSCDVLPTDSPAVDSLGLSAHIQGDVRDVLGLGWDLMVAHPPCTHLAVSGARWFGAKQKEQAAALAFVQCLLDAPIERIALENPISIISSRIRKPTQIVQPHWFGDPFFKGTCLWLKNLPALVATKPLKIPLRGTPEWTAWNKVHRMPPGPDRGKERSRTFQGIADAMADQWGST